MAVEDLLPGATVRIDIGHTPSGTGFFVAPGQVLTCAHVIEAAALGSSTISSQIQVVDSLDRRYEVTAAPATDPAADLAWLTLPSAPVDVPIALLFHDARGRDELSAYGFPPGKLAGIPATFEVEGMAGGPVPLIKFKEGQVQPGMSGAPLLNLRTGAVCGLVRRTRDERQSLGGYGIPVEVIERAPFFEELQRHVIAAHGAKSLWLEALTVEQRQLVRPALALDTPSSVVEFVINIGQTADGWIVDAAIHPGRNLGPFKVDLNTVRAEVARLFRAWRSQSRIEDAEQARLLGGVLYRAVVPPDLAAELERLMFDSPDTRVNVNLHFTEETAPDLVHMPWEQLYVPAEAARAGVAIGLRDRATLTRVLLPDPVQHEPPAARRLSVLLIEAPRQYGTSSPSNGWVAPSTQEVSTKVQQLLSSRDQVDFFNAGSISAEQLGDLLSERLFTVVHYVGYGRYYGNADEVALDDGQGNIAWLGPDNFADLINAPPTQLVVLQACMGPSDLVPGDLTMLAKRLLQGGVEAVVASQVPVPDLGAATRLVGPLYHELINGNSLRVAVQRVRRGLRVRPWAQPALFARVPGDLRLLASSSHNVEVASWRGGSGG